MQVACSVVVERLVGASQLLNAHLQSILFSLLDHVCSEPRGHDKTLNLNMHDDLRVQRVIQGFCERGGIEACRVINEIKLRLEAGSGFWSKLRQAGT